MSKIRSKNILIFLLLTSSAALICAYIAQFVFDYQPCVLCLYQRLPFFAIIAFSALALLFKNKKIRVAIISLCMVFLLANGAIAAYQVGVEKKIFKGLESCSSKNLEDITSLEQLKMVLMRTKAVRCDEPELFIFTLSMAAWNVIYCWFLFLAIFLYRRRK